MYSYSFSHNSEYGCVATEFFFYDILVCRSIFRNNEVGVYFLFFGGDFELFYRDWVSWSPSEGLKIYLEFPYIETGDEINLLDENFVSICKIKKLSKNIEIRTPYQNNLVYAK
jgi:hypothetical protein